MRKLYWIDVFLQNIWWWPQVSNIFKKVEKKTSSKEWRPWNLRPKPCLAICFWALLLMISFEDLILAFYIWVLNTMKEVSKNCSQFKHHISIIILFLNIWQKKLWFKDTVALLWSTLPCMHPYLVLFTNRNQIGFLDKTYYKHLYMV